MNTSLLRTKLIPPSLKPETVPREELVAQIEDGLIGPNGFTRKLTLICAPAGFGKSTVVSQWMNRADYRVGYLALDVEDNVPERFWVYFFEAVRGACESVRDDALTAMSSGVSADPGTRTADEFEPIERFLTLLLNDIFDSCQPVVLVLDDVHAVSHELISRGMRFALRNQPPNLHIVAVTRVEPKWELNRLRSRGEMVEIGEPDLRFRTSEIEVFFRDTMNCPVARDDVASLESESEGWIAGLKLAALSIRAGGGMEGLRRARHLVHGFFSEQVIDGLPADIRDFLFSTSILSRLSGPLCNAVTGTTGGADVLARLERENYFVSALGGDAVWFRYHSLFRDALQTRLRATRPDSVADLHRRAYLWYDQNGHREEAVRHAIEAGETDRAAEIVERGLDGLGDTGNTLETRRLLTMIPDALLHRRPILLVLSAYFAFLAGRYDDVENRLIAAENIVPSSPGNPKKVPLKGLIATIRAMAAVFSGNREELDRNSAIADRLITRSASRWRGLTCAVVGDAALLRGDIVGAIGAYTEACDLGFDPDGNPYFALVAGVKLARLLLYRKGTYASESLCRRMLAFAETHGYGSGERAAAYHGLLGQIHSERGEIDAAVEYCRRGIAIAERDHVAVIWCWCVAHMVRPLIIRRRFDEAHDWIRRAESVLADSVAPFFESLIVGWKIRVLLAERDVTRAEALLTERRLFGLREEAFIFREEEFGSLARFFLLAGRYLEGSELLGRYLAYTGRLGLTTFTAEIEFLLAAASYHLGRPIEARSLVKSALSNGREAGYRRMFVDDASFSRVLLEDAHAHRIEPEFCASLLAEMNSEYVATPTEIRDRARAPKPVSVTDWCEPLSEREIEVLTAVTTGLTNQEIADTLFVSHNTVKWHLARIFGKLGVDNRTHAAAEARRLGLVAE
ncbi:MAG: hypothetical protein EA426_02120 [Spirochaetaceae bacterium]|nr:MAG: hypothetical protein EA426_02120 [Spirochaetaceae bacterium]